MHTIIKRLSITQEYFPCFNLQISTSDVHEEVTKEIIIYQFEGVVKSKQSTDFEKCFQLKKTSNLDIKQMNSLTTRYYIF